MDSGRYAFGDQPALLAVAQAIRANDQEAIRAAAKNVPDLQAAGRDGATLLCWAVRQTWQRRELVEAVKTLLSLGADPNYTNGHRESFALAESVHGPASGLRAMLDAGGNPNARSEFGWPIVFMHFKLGYYKDEESARLDLLLDRGADINSTVPETESDRAGYTLLLYTTQNGLHDSREYADALHLLERGADPNRVAADGMNFSKMLQLPKMGSGVSPHFWHSGFAVMIRCLLRPSNELWRAMETLNRYIDGGRKRDRTTDLRGIENSDAEYGLVGHGNLAVAAPTASATRGAHAS